MQNSNECKRNFVAVYDGSSSVEDLRNKFCSTVANDVMLVSALAVVRMWADESSRKSRFRILFTTFQERKSYTHTNTHCCYGSPIQPLCGFLIYIYIRFCIYNIQYVCVYCVHLLCLYKYTHMHVYIKKKKKSVYTLNIFIYNIHFMNINIYM